MFWYDILLFYILDTITLSCCIDLVLDMQMILCIELISLHVRMFIPYVNEHIVIFFGSSHASLCKVEFNQSCVGFILCQFACNSALRWNQVFRWNHVRVVCKRVWRNAQNCALKQRLATGSRGWLVTSKLPEDAHKWSMQRSWTVMPAVALQDKKSRLAIQLAHGLDSGLSQVAKPSHRSTLFWKNWLFAFLSHSNINTPYTHEI